MFKGFFSKTAGGKAEIEDTSSAFSKFFRGASSREKKKVFLDVAKKASAEQREVIKSVQLAQ